MKSIAILAIIAVVSTMLNPSNAQNRSSLTLKGGVAGALHSNYKMAIEWNHRGKYILELTGSQQRHNTLASDAFHGIVIQEYALRRTYQTQWGSSLPKNDSGWDYLGTGRPIPGSKSLVVTPLSTYRLTLGLRRYYSPPKRGFNGFIAPAMSAAMHQTYEVGKAQETVVKKSEDWRIGSESSDTRVYVETNYYTQTQHTENKQYWFFGPASQFGLSWHSKLGFMVETRLNVGLNFGGDRLLDSETVKELRFFYGQFDVMVGYRFGW